MTHSSRRSFLQNGLFTVAGAAAGAALVARPVTAAESSKAAAAGNAETHTTASDPWAPLKVIDTNNMDWEPGRAWERKMLFDAGENRSHIMLITVGPGWTGIPSHYHEFHEWVYFLSGDMISNEYFSPQNKTGALTVYREGHWLDRPAYSLHGLNPGQVSSQMGSTLLIQEESLGNFGVVPGGANYDEVYKEVEQFSMPRIVDTVEDMVWQDVEDVDGLKVKRLSDGPGRGFRAHLLWLPAGWSSDRAPDYAKPYYYEEAREFNYVLYGNMALQAYAAPGEPAERMEVGPNYYFERAPQCIFGLADGIVTENSCVWLQVTYANRDAVVSPAPIEDRITV